MSDRLEQLLAAATPGPWDPCWLDDAIVPVPDAKLALRAPDMARLLLDMGAALRSVHIILPYTDRAKAHVLLSRLDALGKDTA